MNVVRRYDYNLPWRGVVVGAVFYGSLSVLMAHEARGTAGVISVCFLGLSALLAVLALILVMRRLMFPRVLELADDAILFPHGFPRTRITRIPYADIIRMTESFRFPGSVGLATASGSFEIAAPRFLDFESYHAARDFVCAQASIMIPRYDERDPSAGRQWAEFPDPIISWVEPEDWPRYRTHLVVSKPLLPRLARALWFLARCFVILFLPWLLLRLFRVPTAPAAEYFWLSTGVTFFFTCLHWLFATYPARATTMSFRENGVTQLSGKQTRDLSYRDCSGWEMVERQFEGRVLHILLLQWRNYVTEVALPDTGIRDRLVQLFHDKRIPQSPGLKPSWESRR
ncbi:MAG: hypothetical protein NTW03_08425 [Verrucomicrobia bacterium]|nr:hypothetical protein [Verrucomicrobiota bacterium]